MPSNKLYRVTIWSVKNVDLDLEYSAILSGQQVAKVAGHKLPELSDLSQQEAFTVRMGQPVCGGEKT